MNTLGKKSEAWVRKYNGSDYLLADYKSSTKKFTFALEVIHGGIQVARSAGFELVQRRERAPEPVHATSKLCMQPVSNVHATSK